LHYNLMFILSKEKQPKGAVMNFDWVDLTVNLSVLIPLLLALLG